jgi:hypothetical protein
VSSDEREAVRRAARRLSEQGVPDGQWVDELRLLGFTDKAIAEAFGAGEPYAEATEELSHLEAIKNSWEELLRLVRPLMNEAPEMTIFEAIEKLDAADQETAMMLLRLHERLLATGPEIPGLDLGGSEAPDP